LLPRHRAIVREWKHILPRSQREELLASEDVHQQVRGAKLKLWAWFHRSLEQAVLRNEHLEHPSRAEYTAMAPLEELFPNRVAEHLRNRYDYARVFLEPGALLWLG
jgi:hypothetical protein